MWPLQVAVRAALLADAPFMAKAQAVLDSPRDQDYPYVVIGDVTEVTSGTFGKHGVDVTQTLHVYSRYAGMREAALILNEAVRVLHATRLTVDGFEPVILWYDGGDAVREPDGDVRHAIMRFRVKPALEE